MLYIIFEIFLGIASSSDLDDVFLSLYYYSFLPRYRLLLLLGQTAVPLKVPLLTIVITGYITKARSIRLLNRVNIYRSSIGSQRGRRSRLLLTVLITITAT